MMMYKSRSAALRLIALLCLAALVLPGLPSASAQQAGPFSFAVSGNADVFKYNADTRTLKLGRCLVVDAQAYHTRGALRPEHQTKETMQSLFDALLDARIVELSKSERAQIKNQDIDPFEYGGLKLYFSSPDDPKKYGHIGFDILDAAQFPARQDVTSVFLYVYNHRKSSYQFYVESQALCALIRELAAESYQPSDLATADSVLMSCGGYTNLTVTDHVTYESQDRAGIEQLAKVFEAGTPYQERISLSDSVVMFRFAFRDGSTLHAYIASAYPKEALESLTFLRTGDRLYTLDRQALNAALAVAGLPDIGETWRAFYDQDWPIKEQ